uniref:Small ribosomal subunit protein mS40 n=1 Tax=Amphilophus citrinellus TaxID=61819 RepID=A0A3Q0RWK1_AMPCI
MATSMQHIAKVLCRLSPSILHSVRQYQVLTCPSLLPYVHPSHAYCKAASLQDEHAAQAAEALTRYKDRPWDYLESEEYIERYGRNPVWAGYRRNHKGGIPPQKTRKTCIRGDKICGNPCPICRDPNIIIHHQVGSPTHVLILLFSGVCMKQQKKLNKAINTAKDHGFLPFQIPHVEFSGEDYSNSHDAVGTTPPPPFLSFGDNWYKWYGKILPDENEVAKVKKTYKAYLNNPEV